MSSVRHLTLALVIKTEIFTSKLFIGLHSSLCSPGFLLYVPLLLIVQVLLHSPLPFLKFLLRNPILPSKLASERVRWKTYPSIT